MDRWTEHQSTTHAFVSEGTRFLNLLLALHAGALSFLLLEVTPEP